MNSYKIYFSIESCGLYKGVDEASLQDNIGELQNLVPQLSQKNDAIYIYTTESKMRVIIWGEFQSDYCTLEINNARHGVNYFKKIFKDTLKTLSAENLESYIMHPKEHGFEAESF